MRRWCSEEEIHDAGRCGFSASRSADDSIVLHDNVDNAIARLLGVARKLARKIRTLLRDRRHHPGDQPGERDDDAHENYSYGPTAAHSAAAKLIHQRIEQIGKDDCHGDGNQNRLEKADQVGSDINNRAGDNDKQNDKQRGERRPHCPLLPRRRIGTHKTAAQETIRASAAPLMNGVCIQRLAFAHFGLGVVDLLAQLFVLRVKIECFLPRIQSLRDLIYLRESVSDMFKHNRIVAR
jgi:hypothetical protein